jgi:hypothetical protein
MPQSGVSVGRARQEQEEALDYGPSARANARRAERAGAQSAERPRNLTLVPPPSSRPASPGSRSPRPASARPAPRADRRTITITGHGAERNYPSTYSRRRPARPVHHRPGFRPDRAAMWAVLLGFLLVLVAATSSHAAIRTHAAKHAGAAATRTLVRHVPRR